MLFVKYTPKPLNNKASSILNLPSKKLSNSKLERGSGVCYGKLTHPFIVRLSSRRSPLFLEGNRKSLKFLNVKLRFETKFLNHSVSKQRLGTSSKTPIFPASYLLIFSITSKPPESPSPHPPPVSDPSQSFLYTAASSRPFRIQPKRWENPAV